MSGLRRFAIGLNAFWMVVMLAILVVPEGKTADVLYLMLVVMQFTLPAISISALLQRPDAPSA